MKRSPSIESGSRSPLAAALVAVAHFAGCGGGAGGDGGLDGPVTTDVGADAPRDALADAPRDGQVTPDGGGPTCGDGTCGAGERCENCAADCGPCPVTRVLDVRVAAGSDDAEEYRTSGAVDLTSSDLELTLEAAPQWVGMRFALSIPPGAAVTRAYIQFAVDETSADPTSLVLEAEAADDAAAFVDAARNLSARPRTTAMVRWDPPAWMTTGEAGAAQRSAEIAPLVQEVLGRPGWAMGNHLVVLVSGDGHRVADSYDGTPALAPRLHVEYATPGTARCGDMTCEPGETCLNCAADCGSCAAGCGDATCDETEHCQTCPADCGACAGAAPMVSRGPYLQSGATDAMIVRWRTEVPTDSVVAYGPGPGRYAGAVRAAASVTEHVVQLAGLAAGTRYHYAVGATGAPLVGGDAEHFFATSPAAPRPTRLWVLGDAGTGGSLQRSVRDAYYTFAGARPADLVLMLGDNAYSSGTDVEYQGAVFDMYERVLRNTVVWPTLGNHDGMSADSATQSGVYYDVFSLPTAGESGGLPSGTEAYYSFNYGGIHFVCLDSFDSSRAAAGPMLTWLRNDLAAASQEWLVAFWHHPPYTRGSHDSNLETELREMRANALPILESFGVDLVLTGHSHSYERTNYLRGHYGLSSTLTAAMVLDRGDGRPAGDGAYTRVPGAPEGAVYVVAGSSGQTTAAPLDHPAMHVSLLSLGSMVIDVDGRRLDATFLDSAGHVADSFTLAHE